MSRNSENKSSVIFRCTACGCGIRDGDAIEYRGDLYCPRCIDDDSIIKGAPDADSDLD